MLMAQKVCDSRNLIIARRRDTGDNDSSPSVVSRSIVSS